MENEIEKPYHFEPTSDFAFKHIFGREEGKISLLSLLNAILDGKPSIKDVKILNTETKIEDPDKKASRLDIEAVTDNGIIINVEIQCRVTADLYNRAVVYTSDLLSNNIKKGKAYNFPNVISIWIIKDKINYGNIKKRIAPIEDIIMCMQPTAWGDNYAPFVDQLRIIWIQLAKFKNKELMNNINELLRNWIQFFEKPEEIKSNDKGITKAKNEWEKITSDAQMKAQRRAREKYERDRYSELYCAREEGIKEGKIEEKKQIALNMKSQCLDDEFISKCLNISINELQKLLLDNTDKY